MGLTPASPRGRRRRHVRGPMRAWLGAAVVVAVLLAAWQGPPAPAGAQRRWVVAFANATEEPGVTLEGTGFTGAEIRESFNLAVAPISHRPGLLRQPAQRRAGRGQRRGGHRPQSRSLHPVPPRRAGQRYRRAEAQGRGHSGPGGELSRAGGAALQHRQRGGRPPGGRGPGAVRHPHVVGTTDGRRGHRPSVGRRRPRAGAGPGRERDAAPAPACRAAHDARHPGQPRAGRHAAGRLSRRASRRERFSSPPPTTPPRWRPSPRSSPRAACATPRSSVTVSIAASTAARTTARRSTRTIVAASSSARWRSTWIAWATRCCRSPSGCSAVSRCRRSPRRRTSSSRRPTCSSSTRPTT